MNTGDTARASGREPKLGYHQKDVNVKEALDALGAKPTAKMG